MKRMYRGFKTECPNGLVTEDGFHNIFSKFFPLGGNSYNGECFMFSINVNFLDAMHLSVCRLMCPVLAGGTEAIGTQGAQWQSRTEQGLKTPGLLIG